ncbi:MAG TPA: iron ABC transporter permease [Myxococcota bacterium]|nr:iron ABC transporter permease [Myxococcota bacterium]
MRQGLAWMLVVPCVLPVAALMVGVGTSGVDLLAVLHPDPVVWAVRWPRVILGALSGGALAAAGVVLQAVLRNPLADPYVAGVSGGAALGGVLALALGVAGPFTLPLWAFAGAVVSVTALLALARVAGRQDPLTLLLAGVVFNAFSAALVTFIKIVVTANKAQEILFWLMGALGSEPPAVLVALALYVAVGLGILALGAGALNLLALGDDDAAAHGVPVAAARLALFLAAALLVGAVVAVAGMVAFVGLVVPHTLRLLLGADHRRLLPAATAAGAAFMMLADALARLLFLALGTEVPVGVVTACLGGPFFLSLLLRRQAA